MAETKFSLFKGYSDTCPVETSLSHLIHLIREDETVKNHTEKHRYYLSQGLTTPASREKAACPCFAVAVRFDGGKQLKNIASWTGFSLADLDHVPAQRMQEVLQCIRADKHTLLSYVTMSGEGIRILFRMEWPGQAETGGKTVELYKKAFLAANSYYSRLTGVECDGACKNPTRLSGLAADPNVFFNPDAVPFVFSMDDLGNIRNGRLERVMAAVNRELKRAGVEYVEHHRNDYIMRMGYLLNEYGLPLDEALRWVDGRFTDYEGNVEAIFRSCYVDTSKFGSRVPGKGKPRKEGQEQGRKMATVSEIEDFLSTQASFRYNVITGQYEMKPIASHRDKGYVEVTDRMVNSLWSRMCKQGGNPRLSDLRNVLESEFVEDFNPFEHYFNHLPPWDGKTDHIARLANTVQVCSNQQHFVECFRKWLVAAVASLLNPRIINHEILVLVGAQGAYKTTWFSRLLPEELSRYFYLKTRSSQLMKDDVLRLSESGLICLEEIDELPVSELNQLKALVTSPEINERRPYGHYKEKRPHIASFCATTNSETFLSDRTGNRRWMPFEVKSIEDPYETVIDYEGVYAHALALWREGFCFWFGNDEIREINAHNEQFETTNMELEVIQTGYRRPMPGEECQFMTVTDIMARAGFMLKMPLSTVKIGLALKKLGFEQVRAAGKRGYRVIPLNDEEIHHNRLAMGRYTEPPAEGEASV
jgi:hypothetical protein